MSAPQLYQQSLLPTVLITGPYAEPSFSPRGRSVANGSLGHPGELQLPDGDDLLGMTAHTPAGAIKV